MSKEDISSEDSSNNFFSLVIDENTSLFNFLSSQAYLSEEPKFLIFNGNLNSMDQYNLYSGKIEKRIPYPKDGPNSIPVMQIPFGFHFVNSDTLVLFSGILEKLYLANLEGEIYRELELSGRSVGFGSVGPVTPMAYKAGKIYIQTLPHIPIEKPTNYLTNFPGIAEIDLSSGEYQELPLSYPKEYENKEIAQQLKMVDLVYNQNIDRFIISFPLSEKLLITNFKDQEEWISIDNELIEEPIEINKSNKIVEPSRLNNLYYWMNSSYENLIYDSKLNIYIREARSGISEDAYINRNLTSERKLLILDSNFQLLKKVNFSGAEMFYHFFLEDTFFWNKDIQMYNIQRGIEDTLYFNQTKIFTK